MSIRPVIAGLEAILGPTAVSQDPAELHHWGRDWTRSDTPAPWAVCWPKSTAEVAATLRWCREHGVPVVPSGGRTGLAGGAMAIWGELVLSLDRLRFLGQVDVLNRSVSVGAGVPNQVLQDHCAPHGLWWPVDLASKGSATIGGNLATNAGGLRVVRYGHARRWLLGLEAVGADGQILCEERALHKDNSGTDLGQLLIGSEGTLAVITAATLQLAALPGPTTVALLACPSMEAVLQVLGQVRKHGLDLHAFEVFSDFCLTSVVAHTGVPRPLKGRAPYYTLVEFGAERGDDLGGKSSGGTHHPTIRYCTDQWLSEITRSGAAVDGTLAFDPRSALQLWAYRERITESLQASTPRKNDISVPVSQLAAFTEALQQWLAQARPGWEVALFGHVGDGNLHLNTLRPSGMDMAEFQQHCDVADAQLYKLVASYRGSISAEHGIGLIKKRWLPMFRTPAELQAMAAVKNALDPAGMLNPGKVL